MVEISVAIVEDLADVRGAMQLLIDGSPGFSCRHVCANGEKALRELPGKDIQVVLMDINLPGMNGVECMIRLKRQMPGVLFMMCTIYEDDENIFHALQNGAMGYLLKRTLPAQILDAIRELAAGGSPMNSSIARRVVDSLQQDNRNAATAVLTERELEILKLLQEGFLYKEIADKLIISRETVKKHIHHIYEKLQVQTRTEALNKAFYR